MKHKATLLVAGLTPVPFLLFWYAFAQATWAPLYVLCMFLLAMLLFRFLRPGKVRSAAGGIMVGFCLVVSLVGWTPFALLIAAGVISVALTFLDLATTRRKTNEKGSDQ